MQVNSEFLCLSCTYDFSIEGDCVVPNTKQLGLSINPGTAIWNCGIKFTKPLTTSGNPAVDTFTIFLAAGFGVILLTDTFANIAANFALGNMYNSVQAGYTAYANTLQNAAPIASNGVFQVAVTSTASVTGGQVLIALNVTQHDI